MRTFEHSRNIHEARFGLPREGGADFLLSSDWHYDNPHCDRDLLHRHLDEAKYKGALVCCFGDLFCFMQGKYDKRSDKSDIRPEHVAGDYIDTVIMDTAEKLKPYHDILFVLSLGNHESAIRNRHETNVMERLVQAIRMMTPTSPVQLGGYGGWLVVSAGRGKDTGRVESRVAIKYFHGSGGGGPVTKGAIQQQRAAVVYEGAEIVYMGHVHEHQSTVFVKERMCPSHTKIELVEQEHLRGATYKEEYGDGNGGFHVECGRPPKPLGGWWVNVHLKKRKNMNVKKKLGWECKRAK